jgi:hypothetical protein
MRVEGIPGIGELFGVTVLFSELTAKVEVGKSSSMVTIYYFLLAI